MMSYIVYKHTAPNGKSYIGMTCQTLERRARNGRGYVGCDAFWRAIEKYGWENFKHEVLAANLSYDEACDKEQFFIREHKSLTTENGYNLENGGQAACKTSEETRRKISASLTGRKGTPHTEESKRKISEARRGKKSFPRSDEYRRKLSAALTGRVFTPEHRANIRRGKIGRKLGKDNPRARSVLCVETGTIFETVKDAGEFTGGSSKNIISCCRGRLKTSGGYHWMYVAERGEG